MPLAHSPYHPSPEVELLQRTRISVAKALKGLEGSLKDDRGGIGIATVPGSSLVHYRQIPEIVRCLKSDWLPLPEHKRCRCFVEVHGRLETHMHPCFLGDRMLEGMRGAVGSMLLRFNRSLGCTPIGFRKLEPAGSRHAAVVAESPYMHFLIDFWAIGFAPQANTAVIARTSEAQTAIGFNAKMLGTFNCFVQRSFLPTTARFDAEAGTWMVRSEGKTTPLVRVDLPIWVKVKEIKNGEFRGELDLERCAKIAASVGSPKIKRKRAAEAAEAADAAVPAPATPPALDPATEPAEAEAAPSGKRKKKSRAAAEA